MPHFHGVTASGEPRTGHITTLDVRAFVALCHAEGWRRLAVSEVRILASFNEQGEWLHPEFREAG